MCCLNPFYIIEMSSPKEKKQKKESDEKPPFIDLDVLLLRIIRSPSLSFRERIELRKLNKQFRRLVDEYYSSPESLEGLLYSELLVLRKLYRNRADIVRLIHEIDGKVDEFMGEETGRISVLTRKLRSGEFSRAIAERLRDRIQDYLDGRQDYFFPENQLAITANSQRDYSDIQKKLTMLNKYINREQYSSKKTSSLGKYYQDEFGF